MVGYSSIVPVTLVRRTRLPEESCSRHVNSHDVAPFLACSASEMPVLIANVHKQLLKLNLNNLKWCFAVVERENFAQPSHEARAS